MKQKKVYILIGLPGSGKSTWTEEKVKWLEKTEWAICSADTYFIKDGEYQFDPTKLGTAHRQCFIKFDTHVSVIGTETVIVDNTNIHPEHRQPYIELAEKMGYIVTLKFFPCSPESAFNRNKHGVPMASIQRMHNALCDQGYTEE